MQTTLAGPTDSLHAHIGPVDNNFETFFETL